MYIHIYDKYDAMIDSESSIEEIEKNEEKSANYQSVFKKVLRPWMALFC